MGAYKFNVAPKFLQNGGFSAPNFVFLDENYPTKICRRPDRLKFKGGGVPVCPPCYGACLLFRRVRLAGSPVHVCVVDRADVVDGPERKARVPDGRGNHRPRDRRRRWRHQHGVPRLAGAHVADRQDLPMSRARRTEHHRAPAGRARFRLIRLVYYIYTTFIHQIMVVKHKNIH